jgi:hypothetical protein
MESLLQSAGRSIALAVEAIAVVLIAVGAIEAIASIVRVLLTPRATVKSDGRYFLDREVENTSRLQHVGRTTATP